MVCFRANHPAMHQGLNLMSPSPAGYACAVISILMLRILLRHFVPGFVKRALCSHSASSASCASKLICHHHDPVLSAVLSYSVWRQH